MEQQVGQQEAVCDHWMENRVMGMLWGVGRWGCGGGKLADRMEDRSAGLVPSRARTCEHRVDTPHQPPSPPLHLPSRLSFST